MPEKTETKVIEFTAVSLITGTADSGLRALAGTKENLTSQPIRERINDLVTFFSQDWVKEDVAERGDSVIVVLSGDMVGGLFPSQVAGDSKIHKISLANLATITANVAQSVENWNTVMRIVKPEKSVSKTVSSRPVELEKFREEWKKNQKTPSEVSTPPVDSGETLPE